MRKLFTVRSVVIVSALSLLVAAAAVLLVFVVLDAPVGDPAPTAGCSEVISKELYVQHAYECPDGTRVLTFIDDAARDDFLKIAEHFGATLVEQGPAWARTRN